MPHIEISLQEMNSRTIPSSPLAAAHDDQQLPQPSSSAAPLPPLRSREPSFERQLHSTYPRHFGARDHHAESDQIEEEDRAELEAYREAAGKLRAPASLSDGGQFEPFGESRVGSPIPDPHGLGWPGAYFLMFQARALFTSFPCSGKGTLARLNSTAAQKEAREAKLAAAVRTLLECIGEDPERDGLIKTPERYAKALLWMTKGYEERLPGASANSCPYPGVPKLTLVCQM